MSHAPDEHFAVRVAKGYFNFDAAHFLVFADGQREALHGHNYRVEVALHGPLGPGDLVFDFIVLKPIVREVCEALDHKVLLPTGNPFVDVRREGNAIEVRHGADRFVFPASDVTIVPIRNTSAECFARYIGERVLETLRVRHPESRLERIDVEVEETPGQSSLYSQHLGG